MNFLMGEFKIKLMLTLSPFSIVLFSGSSSFKALFYFIFCMIQQSCISLNSE